MMTELSLSAFRARFPGLGQHTHLASCSYAPRSVMVAAALEEMQRALDAEQPWAMFEQQVEALRERLARLLWTAPGQISLQPNATVAAFQAASSLDWRQRPRILACRAEFPSLAQVWAAQQHRGAELVLLDFDPDPALMLEAYRAAIDERVGLVSVPAMDFVSGRRLPVREVAALARRHGALSLCDAYQQLGVEPVDVMGLQVDFLVAGAMKYLLGLPGLAFLVARDPDAVQRQGELTGWQGRADPFAFNLTALDHPGTARRFETGTPAIAPVYAALAGVDTLLALGLHQVADRIASLKHQALQSIPELAGSAALARSGSGHFGCGHLALHLPDAAGARLLDQHLREHRIRASPRLDTLRIAFHAFNGPEDVEHLVDALSAARRRGIRLSKEPFQ